jgi:hypothetical protein
MSEIVDQIEETVARDPIDFDRLEELFGEASEEERVGAIRRFSTDIQRRLFEAAEGRTVTLSDVVPTDVPPMNEVIHAGQNTLPVFRAFQKRFCRPRDRKDRLWGYNEQTFKAVTGPGYFIAYDDHETGEVCIDYREVPPESPDNWPDVKENTARLGRFVYAGTVDRLRRVADGVTIGRAFVDDDEPMDNWFALVRT